MTQPAIPHDWIPSRLGHGETMCRRCCVTNREAAVLGILYSCPTPPAIVPEHQSLTGTTREGRTIHAL